MDLSLSARAHLRRMALIAIAAVLLQPPAARAEVTTEYKLKAAYLLNFVRFSKWPTNSFAAADAPLVIGVLGENPFDTALGEIVRGRIVNGRTVVVKRVATAQEAKLCQVVFIPASEQANLPRHLETLRDAPVLTIGENADFLDDGGIIRFFIQQNKIRFDINKAQADATGMQIDSQLLSLAADVRESNRKKGN